MAIELNDNVRTRAPKPSDDRFGPYSYSAGTTEATAIADVLTKIVNAERYEGLPVGIKIGTAALKRYVYNGSTFVADTVDMSTKEDVANKVTAIITSGGSANSTSTSLYPSVKAVVDFVNSVTPSVAVNQIVYGTGSGISSSSSFTYIASSGNVLIGTSVDAGYRIHMATTSTTGGIRVSSAVATTEKALSVLFGGVEYASITYYGAATFYTGGSSTAAYGIRVSDPSGNFVFSINGDASFNFGYGSQKPINSSYDSFGRYLSTSGGPLILNYAGGQNVLIGTRTDNGDIFQVQGNTTISGTVKSSNYTLTYGGATALTMSMLSGSEAMLEYVLGGSSGYQHITFGTNYLKLTPWGGKVAINMGTTAPTYTLDVSGDGRFTSNVAIGSGGNLMVGTTTNAGFRLDVNGTARLQGTVTLSSVSASGSAFSVFLGLDGSNQVISRTAAQVLSDINALSVTAASDATGGNTTLVFDTDRVYGTPSVPKTGTITLDATAAKLGVTHIVIHNAGSAPTLSSAFKRLSGSTGYIPSTNNYIYFTFINATNILYSINQAV